MRSLLPRCRPMLLAATIALLVAAVLPDGVLASGTTAVTGASADGSRYLIEVPANYRGTLVLYSHGYAVSGPAQPPDAGDGVTHDWLLANGYALAGSTYASAGWALEQAFPDQLDVLDQFAQKFGKPARTIAWGHSLGGMITAGLIQLHPERFSGAVPMCGVLGGGLGAWNQGLDSEFAFKTLVAPGASLQLVGITNPQANLSTALTILSQAQQSPQGRARIALAAALSDVPGWFDPASPEPAPTDYAAQEVNQYRWDGNPDFFFSFAARAELEARAGGNFSWNTGVDYEEQLARSADREEVRALYRSAGLDLRQDLEKLAEAPRISANPSAADYVRRFISYDGDISVPVLTMHTTGDGLVQPSHEQAYAAAVREADNQPLLRETFVHRAGHCTFTPAETVAAFKTLVHRLDTGRWGDAASPAAMNGTAGSLGIGPSAFIAFKPPRFLRPGTEAEPEGGG